MRLFTLRGPVLRVPWPLVLLAWSGRALWALLRWLAVHPGAVGSLAAALGLWVLIRSGSWPLGLAVAGGICVLAGGAMVLRPRWWTHVEETVASWRRRRWYEARWELALNGAGLVGVEEMPTLLSHRFGGAPGERDLDVLTVRMAAGQLVSDWRAKQVRLAGTWELQRLRAHAVPGQPRDVQLLGRRIGPSPEVRQRWADRSGQLEARHLAGAEPSSPARGDDASQLGPDDASAPAASDTSPPAGTTRPGAFPRAPRSDR